MLRIENLNTYNRQYVLLLLFYVTELGEKYTVHLIVILFLIESRLCFVTHNASILFFTFNQPSEKCRRSVGTSYLKINLLQADVDTFISFHSISIGYSLLNGIACRLKLNNEYIFTFTKRYTKRLISFFSQL